MIDKESEDELSYARFVPTLLPDEPLGEPLPAANVSLPKSFALDHPEGLNATVEVFDLPEVYDEYGQHISSSFGPQSFESGARGAVAPPAVGRTEDGRLVSTVPIASDLDSKVQHPPLSSLPHTNSTPPLNAFTLFSSWSISSPICAQM